jgi:hypothetical protein
VIVYYHYSETANHIQRRDAPRHGDSRDDIAFFTIRSQPYASLVTAINVLVASGFSIAGLISPKSILPAGYALTEVSFIFAMYAASPQHSPRPYGSNRDL